MEMDLLTVTVTERMLREQLPEVHTELRRTPKSFQFASWDVLEVELSHR
jgi:hypothetical protein